MWIIFDRADKSGKTRLCRPMQETGCSDAQVCFAALYLWFSHRQELG